MGATVVGALLYASNHGNNVSQTKYDIITILLLLLLSLLNFIGQIVYGLACRYEQAARVAAIGYLTTPLVMIYDFTIFGTIIGFREILGAILIIGCNFAMTMARVLKLIE